MKNSKLPLQTRIANKLLLVWTGAMEIINIFIMPVLSRVILGVGFAGFLIQNVKGMPETVIFTGAVMISAAMVARSFKK